jgi:hypothetical protein
MAKLESDENGKAHLKKLREARANKGRMANMLNVSADTL